MKTSFHRHGLRAALCVCAILVLNLNVMAADSSEESLPQRIERFDTDRGALRRSYPVRFSEARRERLDRFHEEELDELKSEPFGELTLDDQIDYLLLQDEIRFELKDMRREQERFDAIAHFIPFHRTIQKLAEDRRAIHPIDHQSSAGAMTELAKAIRETQESFEKKAKDAPDSLSPILANRAASVVDSLKNTLEDWNEFYSGYDPLFSWWLEEPYKEVERNLDNYAKFLREKIAGYEENEDPPILGDPIGRAALLEALEHEMIPYTPEELIEIAESEFAWCEKERLRAARDLGFGDDWRAALNHVKDLHVAPGAQPELIKQLAQEAIDFLEERDLLTIPELAKETWRMNMMSAERQKVSPYFTGGEVISVSFPTSSMSHEDKLMSMRGNNIHFSRATVHHELIPGHHLQLFMANRHKTHRSLFRTPFLVEGWALYWEMLLWDLDFPQSAEDRMGMLFWRSHRCARIIFSLSFHLEKMTAQEAIDFLVERVGHERRNATAEVRRSVQGSYPPLYQAAYMLGGLQLRALHKQLVQGGGMSDKEFHDAVLRENAIPIAMIRAKLINQDLAPDFKSDWRFYHENQ